MLTKEEKQKLLDEKEKNHYKLNELNERIFEINKILEEEKRYDIEQCNIILEDVARCSICKKTYIEVCESTNIPMIKQVYDIDSLCFILKNKKHINVKKCYVALLIRLSDYKASVYLEDVKRSKILGEIKEILPEWYEE